LSCETKKYQKKKERSSWNVPKKSARGTFPERAPVFPPTFTSPVNLSFPSLNGYTPAYDHTTIFTSYLIHVDNDLIFFEFFSLLPGPGRPFRGDETLLRVSLGTNLQQDTLFPSCDANGEARENRHPGTTKNAAKRKHGVCTPTRNGHRTRSLSHTSLATPCTLPLPLFYRTPFLLSCDSFQSQGTTITMFENGKNDWLRRDMIGETRTMGALRVAAVEDDAGGCGMMSTPLRIYFPGINILAPFDITLPQ